jgi:hypothetical protein
MTEEHDAIRAAVREIAEREIAPHAITEYSASVPAIGPALTSVSALGPVIEFRTSGARA